MTHCAPVTNALKFLFRWLGQQSKRARWEDQRGGQVLKRERKIRRAVCSFTLIFFIALLDSQGKRGADDCMEGLGNVEMCRNKAGRSACQLFVWGAGAGRMDLRGMARGVQMVQPLNNAFGT